MHLNLVALRRIGIAKYFTVVPFAWSYRNSIQVWCRHMWRQKILIGLTHLSYQSLEPNVMSFPSPDTVPSKFSRIRER
jgi:hypothetical protein